MPRSERGIGLVEVMLALTLLSVVMMSLGGLMFQVARHTRISAQIAYRGAALNSAANWAQTLPWDSIQTGGGGVCGIWAPNDTIGQLVYQRYTSCATSGSMRTMTMVIQPVATVVSSNRVKAETLTVVRAKPLTTAPLKVR